MAAMEEHVEKSRETLRWLARERPVWFLAFSGGKDSTALLVLAVELLRQEQPPGVRLHVLYADTRLEIPPMARHAARMLAHVREIADREGLPIDAHIVQSPVPESFWVRIIGAGYPAPGFRFRWCTDRLKARPMNQLARSLVADPERGVMLVGIRMGESDARDGRMRSSCAHGECGPAAVGRASIFPTAAPLRDWKSCQVWDFLAFVAPRWGWPTGELWRLYGEDERIRYGCWVCPLVRRDRAMEAAIRSADGERPALEAMAAFRERLLVLSRDPAGRERRPDGRPGRLTLERRRQIMRELLALQERIGQALITPGEIQEIQRLWEEGHGEEG